MELHPGQHNFSTSIYLLRTQVRILHECPGAAPPGHGAERRGSACGSAHGVYARDGQVTRSCSQEMRALSAADDISFIHAPSRRQQLAGGPRQRHSRPQDQEVTPPASSKAPTLPQRRHRRDDRRVAWLHHHRHDNIGAAGLKPGAISTMVACEPAPSSSPRQRQSCRPQARRYLHHAGVRPGSIIIATTTSELLASSPALSPPCRRAARLHHHPLFISSRRFGQNGDAEHATTMPKPSRSPSRCHGGRHHGKPPPLITVRRRRRVAGVRLHRARAMDADATEAAPYSSPFDEDDA